MLYLSYTEPIDRENLPALNASFSRLKARIRRRRILSGVCGTLCLLLFSALMILGTVGLFRRLAGPEYAAVLDSLPHAREIFTLFFQTLPERLGMEYQLPELVYLPVAVFLPPVLCMPVALLLRLLLRLLPLGGKSSAERSAEELLSEARKLSERSGKNRKARWTVVAGFLVLLVCGAAAVYCLIAVHPAGEAWEVKKLLLYAFLGIVAFFCFLIQAVLSDIPLELFCGLDAQWDGTKLIEDLEAFLARENAPAAAAEPAPTPSPAETDAP